MAEGKGTYSSIYRMIGAAKAAAENRKVAASMQRVLSMSGRLRAGMLGMSSALAGTGAALVGLGMAARRVVNAYGEYTIAQSRVRTTLAAQVPNYRAVSRVVGQHADMVGRRLGYSLTESNEAMMTMLQTGLGVHRSMRVFSTSMQLARVADMDTANATRFLTDTMNMFRVEAARNNEEVQEFARRMATQLSVAANMASTDIESLQQAFRYAGGEMSAMGFSSRDVMSALAALSSVGLRSTTAGTRLRGAIAALHTPSSTTIGLFRQWNISQEELQQTFYRADGSLRPLREGMTNLSTLFRRLPSDQARNTALIRLFGRRALAAGATVTGLTEAGDRMASIHRRLSQDDITKGTILDDMAEERTRSFGFQVEQLKQGITDLAIAFGEILFGAMDDSNQGFGTHVRNVAAAIRLAGNLEDMTAAQRREWNALSPEVRQSGQRYRELFQNISLIIRALADLVRLISAISNYFPRATLAVIALTVALGPRGMVGAMRMAGTGIVNLGGHLLQGSARMRTAGVAARAATGALALLGIEVAGRLTSALQDFFIEKYDMGGEMDNLRRSTVAAHAEIARQIPIIGRLVAQYVELAGAIQGAIRARIEERRRRQTQAQQEFGTAQQQVENRFQRMRASQRNEGVSDEELRSRATIQERGRSITRLATLLGARRMTNQRDISAYLRTRPGGGMGSEQSTRVAAEIARVQRSIMTQGMDSVRAQAVNMSEASGGLTAASAQAARQLSGLDTAAVAARNALESISVGVDTAGQAAENSQMSVPSVNDGFVQRGGLLRAASGDVVVSRQHLARAVAARRGAMVGPAMGEGVGDRTMAGPAGSGGGSGGGGGVAEVTIPVMLDGTEIARAVGQAHIRHLERSGASFSPEQRRTMRESGFTERLG